MLKGIIFDLDDTLLNDKKSIEAAFHATVELAVQKYSIDGDLLKEKVREWARKQYATYSTYDFTREIGINPFEGLWGTFEDKGEDFQALHKIAPDYQRIVWREGLEALGIRDDDLSNELAKAFPAFRKQHPFVFEDTFTVLNQLKDNYQLVMLTNGSPSLQKTKLELTPALLAYFDTIFISGDFGIGKPDPSLFNYLLEETGLTTSNSIMVGDNLNTDILGANRVGMKNVWINRNNQKTKEIQPTYEIDKLVELVPIINSL
ncbi:HAD family hydrolase [Ornithinibacillus californiensis]|uniref:HAD family hydrolase n=1 Tax=Ornithinibacillus californiensis TaxID=161536 RepID=UPI00064DEBF2|nr:HAD family hydrolase [Ornithinibacillus californiensis]